MIRSTSNICPKAMAETLASRANADGIVSYAEFIACALYHPSLGYYHKDKTRIGKTKNTDFYTASSIAPLFGDLVLAATTKICEENNLPLSQFHFVELGVERNQPLLRNHQLPFQSLISISVGDNIEIPPNSIVFSNELFDAQPFHRLLFENNQWKEIGVKIDGYQLSESLLPIPTEPVRQHLDSLPPPTINSTVLDISFQAESLLQKICRHPWNGFFLAFDYGKTTTELLCEHPNGTARTYHKHKQSNELLANAGDQDITCHVIWDRLESVLAKNKFHSISLERQESFFMHHAKQLISQIITDPTHPRHKSRSVLNEIIHPAYMGHKFQALWAIRED